LSREEIKLLVIENGGKLSSVVNSKTKIIIGGESIGPSKKLKAETLKIPIITEKEFLEMLNT
jgi:DNA ligase (NAD+)